MPAEEFGSLELTYQQKEAATVSKRGTLKPRLRPQRTAGPV